MSLLNLPPEIRNKIYGFACPQVRLLIGVGGDNVPLPDRQMHHQLDIRDARKGLRASTNLMLTCRKLHAEVSGFMYSQITFGFNAPAPLAAFFARSNPTTLAAIRRIELFRQFPDPQPVLARMENALLETAWRRLYLVVREKMTGLEHVTLSADFSHDPLTFNKGSFEYEWFENWHTNMPRPLPSVHINLLCNNDSSPSLVDQARKLADSMMDQQHRQLRDLRECQHVLAEAIRSSKPVRTLILKLRADSAAAPAVRRTKTVGLDGYTSIHLPVYSWEA